MVKIAGEVEISPREHAGQAGSRVVSSARHTLQSLSAEADENQIYRMPLPDPMRADLARLRMLGFDVEQDPDGTVPISLRSLGELPGKTEVSLFISVKYTRSEMRALGMSDRDPHFDSHE